ncbi:hypothetical protein HAX54_028673, partial [Datura stramonium]|nr:hypothetical protein [Datura stramonium]
RSFDEIPYSAMVYPDVLSVLQEIGTTPRPPLNSLRFTGVCLIGDAGPLRRKAPSLLLLSPVSIYGRLRRTIKPHHHLPLLLSAINSGTTPTSSSSLPFVFLFYTLSRTTAAAPANRQCQKPLLSSLPLRSSSSYPLSYLHYQLQQKQLPPNLTSAAPFTSPFSLLLFFPLTRNLAKLQPTTPATTIPAKPTTYALVSGLFKQLQMTPKTPITIMYSQDPLSDFRLFLFLNCKVLS